MPFVAHNLSVQGTPRTPLREGLVKSRMKTTGIPKRSVQIFIRLNTRWILLSKRTATIFRLGRKV